MSLPVLVIRTSPVASIVYHTHLYYIRNDNFCQGELYVRKNRNLSTESRLKEEIFRVFNIEKPADFKGHSLSISDVVVLDGMAYYVDVYGFKRIENFKEETNAQKGRKIDHISGGKHNDSNTHT